MNEHFWWDAVYKKDINTIWGKQEPDRLLEELVKSLFNRPWKSAISMLDIGCGNGRHSRLSSLPCPVPVEYTGVDFSPEALDYCRTRYARQNHRFILSSMLTQLPLDRGMFDLIIDFGCLHAIPPGERRAHAANILRAAGKKAYLIVGAWYSPEQNLMKEEPDYYPLGILKEWYLHEKDIETLFAPAFSLESFQVSFEPPHSINNGFVYTLFKKEG